MSDATREQIKRDAEEWADAMLQAEEDFDKSSFESGCEHQHPIAFEAGKKSGRNEAIEEALKAFAPNLDNKYGPGAWEETKRKLENLRKP